MPNYDSQVLGLLIEGDNVEGLVYISNDMSIGYGANFIKISEISLFSGKKLPVILPFLIKEIHRSLVLKYFPMIVMIVFPLNEEYRETYKDTARMFNAVDIGYKCLSQGKPYCLENGEKL